MSLPIYPDYKDSGDLLFGQTPTHWPKSALKHIARFKNGYPFKPDDWSDEGLPIIRIAQLTGEDKANYFSGKLDDNLLVKNGDLLFTWSATIDSFIWHFSDAWLNQHIFKVTPNEGVDKLYLFYLIKFVAPKLADIDAHGSTMKHIKVGSLGQQIYLPPIYEQTAIANFLDRETAKIDVLIAEQEKLIELLAEKRQATISRAVTKGLNPDAPMKDSGVAWLGEVPAHWEIKKLKHIGVAKIGLTYDPCEVSSDGEGVLVLRSSNVQGGRIEFEDNVFVNKEIPEILRTKVDDILICSRNGSKNLIGKNALITDSAAELTFGAFMTVFRSSLNRYLFWVFNSQLFTYQSGTFLTSTINQLTTGNLYSFEIPLPPQAEQKIIENFLSRETEKIEELTIESKKVVSMLKERRAALISAAVTGKIDVRNLVEKEAA